MAEQNEDLVTGPDLGVAAVIWFWIYGIALPISGLWALVTKQSASKLAAYALLQAIARIPRDSPVFTPFRKMYRAMFEGHFTDHQWLTPCYTVDNALNPGAKRQVTLAGPHGLFSLGLNRTMHPEGCKMIMFVDNNLAVFNPFIRMFAKWTGMWDLEGLKHTKVTSALERGECDLIVVAGG
eukprot:TRINITY_DN829_c0_g1_i6.p1 TRINITY_DN829_c0_g1~~TRINITY_DN829_c0_g1_i6.p1  ORF type:complete len:181 (-),score=47.71 TRINITY_DN829_c0_g1_i6:140-682(-)